MPITHMNFDCDLCDEEVPFVDLERMIYMAITHVNAIQIVIDTTMIAMFTSGHKFKQYQHIYNYQLSDARIKQVGVLKNIPVLFDRSKSNDVPLIEIDGTTGSVYISIINLKTHEN